MPRKTKAEAEATREAILDAAEFEFYERGVGCTSLEKIACAAGVTRGAIYWHFRNKQDLFDAMLCRVSNPMVARLEALCENHGSINGLRDICIYSLSQLAENEHHFRVFSILFHRSESDTGMEIQGNLARQAIEKLTLYFHQSHNSDVLNPGISPELAANALQSYFSGLYYEYLGDPGRWNLKQDARTLVDLILRGICKPANLLIQETT
ncbi:TetR family transcriptional regulator [uncultured Marinobacter sp.]|uniref:TetR family transcriptional regulator n=1 Tax=uncultured Marinobacter sp. TaxID=187379 RepID=UPI0030DC649B